MLGDKRPAGATFNRAYIQGGLQAATCAPSRAMLLSGQCLFRIDETLTRDQTWPANWTPPSKAAPATSPTTPTANDDASFHSLDQMWTTQPRSSGHDARHLAER